MGLTRDAIQAPASRGEPTQWQISADRSPLAASDTTGVKRPSAKSSNTGSYGRKVGRRRQRGRRQFVREITESQRRAADCFVTQSRRGGFADRGRRWRRGARNCSPYRRTIAAAGFRRMPTAPRSSTKVHSAAIRLTTSSGVNIGAIPPPPRDAAPPARKRLSAAARHAAAISSSARSALALP